MIDTVPAVAVSTSSLKPPWKSQRPGQRVRVADHVDDVRRLAAAAPSTRIPGRVVLEGGLRDHPDRVVDLDRLDAGVAQLLDAVEQVVEAELALRVVAR